MKEEEKQNDKNREEEKIIMPRRIRRRNMRRDRRRVKVQIKEHSKAEDEEKENSKHEHYKKEKKRKRRRVNCGRRLKYENSIIPSSFHVPTYTVHKMITAQNRRLPDSWFGNEIARTRTLHTTFLPAKISES
jgi:hypothetical protein